MKTSLAWLNRYLDRPVAVEEAATLLTNLGFPTEHWEQVVTASGARDWQLDVEITNNRGDLLSHLGQAREVAAVSGRMFDPPGFELADAAVDAAADVSRLTRVDNEAEDLCPLYTARVIRGVKVGPSPAWLADALQAVGQKPVNNIVDITNFVLLETGQPLHAFDLAHLHEGRIVVRRAKAGEAFEAIDHTKHKLTADTLVIADADRPIAVAGVMGGVDSEVSEGTTDILLESAIFGPLTIRTTSRRLKLASDSSYRFERGLDPCGVERASRRAAQLMVELAGGKVASGVVRVGADEPGPRDVTMRLSRCNELLGTKLDAQVIAGALGRLGLSPRVEGDVLTCAVPAFRGDISREVDLIEEVARVVGLDSIPVQEKIELVVRPRQAHVAARRRLIDVLVAHGYLETVNFTFISEKRGRQFLPEGHEPLLVGDETRKSEPMLRPALLPSLLQTRKTNQDLGNHSLRLFEIASSFSRQGRQVHEQQRVALLMDAQDKDTALRDLRGTLVELGDALLGPNSLRFEEVDHPHFAAAAKVYSVDSGELGVMGLLGGKVQDLFDLQSAQAGAELLLGPLLAAYPPAVRVAPLPRFPGIERDLSIVVDEQVRWSQVEAAVRDAKPALLEALEFLVVYRGKPIPAGRKSVSFRMIFRDPQATLRHEQVDPQIATVTQQLKNAVQAELRA